MPRRGLSKFGRMVACMILQIGVLLAFCGPALVQAQPPMTQVPMSMSSVPCCDHDHADQQPISHHSQSGGTCCLQAGCASPWFMAASADVSALEVSDIMAFGVRRERTAPDVSVSPALPPPRATS